MLFNRNLYEYQVYRNEPAIEANIYAFHTRIRAKNSLLKTMTRILFHALFSFKQLSKNLIYLIMANNK